MLFVRPGRSARDKRAAIADGREVVTPSGAQFLFDRSLTRIRGAARGGEIETRFRSFRVSSFILLTEPCAAGGLYLRRSSAKHASSQIRSITLNETGSP